MLPAAKAVIPMQRSSNKLVLGCIADVQYVDRDDALNFARTILRRYRNARRVLRQAAKSWRKDGDVDVVVQLGDFLDLSNGSRFEAKTIETTFRDLLNDLKVSNPRKMVHLIGNHDLALFERTKLLDLLEMENKSGFYDMSPTPGWRLICLDGYAISVLGHGAAADDSKAIAEAILDKNNPNPWREPGKNFLCGLDGPSKRFVPFNGAYGENQLSWLSSRLNHAADHDECVIVCSHLPVFPCASYERYICLPWDYEHILDILSKTKANVLAFLAGHDHQGGYGVQKKENGGVIHHLTLRGVVEHAGEECHAKLVFSRQDNEATLEVIGAGALDSMKKSIVI